MFVFAVEEQQDEEPEVTQGTDLGNQCQSRGRGQHTQYTQDDEADHELGNVQLVQLAAVTHRAHLAAIQPGQQEQHHDGKTHHDDPEQLVRNRTQNGVEGGEIPHRSDMRRGLQTIRHFKVRLLKEVTPHIRLEENDGAEEEQEARHTDHVLDGEVGVERHRIQRPTVGILVLLDVDAIRVVGANFVQRQDVHRHQHHQYQRQGDDVQRKEAVQGGTWDDVVTTDPQSQVVTDDRNGTKQRDDDLGSPEGHLAPRQQIAHESLGHQHQEDQHAEDPQQLARLLVGAVDHATEHVQIDYHEEGGSPGGVHVTQQPAIFHIPHDVLNGGKSTFRRGVVVHGQPDAGDDLVDQHQHGEGAEEVPEVQVLRCRVLGHVIVVHGSERESIVDPAHQFTQHDQASLPSAPTRMVVSLMNW